MWTNFTDLSPEQKAQAKMIRPKWNLTDAYFGRFQFWVKDDGSVSRISGHHQLTKEAMAIVEEKYRYR